MAEDKGAEEEAMTKSGLLRALLRRPGLVPMVGAHDALSAKLIEAAGFPVVWSSGFAVSAAQRAVPDVNILTMTENLEAARFIDEAVAAPVIADVRQRLRQRDQRRSAPCRSTSAPASRASASRTTSSPSGAASTPA